MAARPYLISFAVVMLGCGSSSSTATATTDGSTSAADADDAAITVADTSGDGSVDVVTDAHADTSPVIGVDGGGAGTITFVNQCAFTVWVGALNNGTTTYLPENGGWAMNAGTSHTISLPAKWGGRFWGRTGCAFDASGKGSCETGDCGRKLQCNGAGGETPASLVELQMAAFGGKDFYDVSLVDGYNLPIRIAPQPGTFVPTKPSDSYACGAPSCTSDANASCPDELKVVVGGRTVGCMAAKEACAKKPSAALDCTANLDLYQCAGGGPNAVSGSCYSPGASSTCCGCPNWSPTGACKGHNAKWQLPAKPETYAKVFKDACPSAYSFPYDDITSTFTCEASSAAGVGYFVTFCP